jgi:hypothetical protein
MKTEIKLTANVGAGEGDIKIMPHFEGMSALWQIDVLKDWIWSLDNEYSKRLGVWRDECKAIRKKGQLERKKAGTVTNKHWSCTTDGCTVHYDDE